MKQEIENKGKGLSVPSALSFPFSPAPAGTPLISSLPIPQPMGKMKETSAEERANGIKSTVQHQLLICEQSTQVKLLHFFYSQIFSKFSVPENF